MKPLRVLLAAFAALVALAIGLPSSPASAGGWALASFDEIPEVEAGTPVDVGFTVLQHGIHPADDLTLWGPDGREGTKGDVGVTVDVDGSAQFFPAEPSGAPGHYVATIEVDRPGAVAMNAEMRWFGSSEPFDVHVAAPSTNSGGWLGWSDAPGWPAVLVGLLGVVCLAFVVFDLAAAWRRRSSEHGGRPISAGEPGDHGPSHVPTW